MATLRLATVSNATGVPLTIDNGAFEEDRDYKLLLVERVFSTADIGSAEGQTQHAAGCLVGQVTSGRIHKIVSVLLQHSDSAGGMVVYSGLGDGTLQIDDVTSTSVYVKDATAPVIISGSALFLYLLVKQWR